MNYCVPEFDMDDDYPIPSSSGAPSSSHPKRPSTADEDIMELLWHNGQLVMQNQSQRLPKRSSHVEQPSSQQQQQQLFMQEDEMFSWLHYPLAEHSSSFDHNLCADLLYPPPPSSTSTTTFATTTVPVRTTHVSISEPKPPPKSSEASSGVVQAAGGGSCSKLSMPPPSSLYSRPRTESGSEPSVQNLGLFSRYKARADGPEEASSSKSAAAAALLPKNTFADSNDTPSIDLEAAKQRSTEGGGKSVVSGLVATGGSCAVGGRAVTTAGPPSPRGSCASGEQQGKKQTPVEDRKRKVKEVEEADEGQSEDIEFESADTKKQPRGSISNKRSRAAEVHNLSERKRRDRINEKMRALQELIPRCNKSDKASMLDEAIEYLKSLQLQVQMFSMGYGMVPMMCPGFQQYMPPMGMGLGMGMNMEMAMNRPMMPYPNLLPSSAFPTTGASAHMGPMYSMPPSPFQMPPTHMQDPALNSVGAPNQIPPRLPLYTDAYQQYLGLPQMQLPLPQNQVMAAPNTIRPGSGGRTDNVDNPKSG